MDPVDPIHLFLMLWASTQFYADFDVLAGNALETGRIGAGDFASIREWQRDHVHGMGRMYPPRETIQRAIGGPLDPGPYLAYMERKVTALYGQV